jgi:hypothetical protein
VEGEGEE